MTGILKSVSSFIKNDRNLPLIAALASGLYPWAFYFSNNYKFVNSWEHFWFFLICFVLTPMVGYYLLYFLLKKKHLKFYKHRLLPSINLFVFMFFSALALYAEIGWKIIILIIILTIGFFITTGFIKNLLPKVLTIQFLLVLTTGYNLAVISKKYLFQDYTWIEQPDHISEIRFKKTPNIYVVQPDGYVNFSEIDKGYYNFDNGSFKNWLKTKKFTIYEDFRSNYSTTLSSNSSLFSMKHHYYGVLDERKIIFNDNPVVKILNANGYTTHFFAEVPYLLTNRPTINFTHTNFDETSLPFLSKGLDTHRDILEDLPKFLKTGNNPQFYFFEKLLPGHITTYKNEGKTNEGERKRYLEKLQSANIWLKEIIGQIEQHDPNGIIIIVADHGGFVGWDYSKQSQTKTDDPNKIKSIFSSLLAVKWPDNSPPEYDSELKTSINLFRILFTYLSNDKSLLDNLQEDKSYIKLHQDGKERVYKYIDDNGKIVLKYVEQQ